MDHIPQISESEWQVIRVLWAQSPATANDIVDRLSARTTWKPKTIKTLLNRLLRKKAVGFEKHGREYHYFPLIEEARCVQAESKSFLQRVYGGTVTPMVAAFIEDQDLSADEIAELKRILNEKAKNHAKKTPAS